MSEVYAVCLSTSQGHAGVSVRAHLLHTDDDGTLEVTVEWPELPAINAKGVPTEWLYSVLSRLLQDYDVNTVTSAKTSPSVVLKGVRQREA